jgi:hypothetical protein
MRRDVGDFEAHGQEAQHNASPALAVELLHQADLAGKGAA